MIKCVVTNVGVEKGISIRQSDDTFLVLKEGDVAEFTEQSAEWLMAEGCLKVADSEPASRSSRSLKPKPGFVDLGVNEEEVKK